MDTEISFHLLDEGRDPVGAEGEESIEFLH
jgi:hypothetical protein